MAKDEEKTLKDWLRIIVPRILRAALWSFIMGGELLIPLYMLPGIGGEFSGFLPVDQTSFSYILFIFIGFEIAIQLLRGTVIPYALSIARALISMIFLIFITNGGIMTLTFSSSPGVPLPPGLVISFTVDFRAILSIFLVFSLLSIIKNLLQATNFLSEKAEEPVVPPEFP